MPEHNQNQFASNLNQFSDNENTAEDVNQQMEKRAASRLQNEIGAKVLSLVNFESKHKDIVESSFNKARNNKEKLPGKNNERRNFAYLSRLNNMVEKYGDKAERKTLGSLCRECRHGLRRHPRRLLETTRTNPKR